jgi:D-alanine-D-alanine ligase
LGLPLFVKPACEGSSIGISMVKEEGGLAAAYAEAAKHDSLVLAERGITGGEYTVAIIGQGDDLQALPIIKIEPATEFYDYEAKYNRDDTRYRCPCGLPAKQEAEIRSLCVEAYAVLGARGWGRVDFLMDAEGRPYLLEVNTSPGMTDHSLVPMAARAAGLDYDALVIEILRRATLGV